MLLIVEKCIRGGISHTMDMQKLIKNEWKIMIKIKILHIFNIGM